MDGKFFHPSHSGPNMDDVPLGQPHPRYRPATIGQGLLDLADWFDIYDDRAGYTGARTVQLDLRAWAKRTMHMPSHVVEKSLKSIEEPKCICGDEIYDPRCPFHAPQNQ